MMWKISLTISFSKTVRNYDLNLVKNAQGKNENVNKLRVISYQYNTIVRIECGPFSSFKIIIGRYFLRLFLSIEFKTLEYTLLRFSTSFLWFTAFWSSLMCNISRVMSFLLPLALFKILIREVSNE